MKLLILVFLLFSTIFCNIIGEEFVSEKVKQHMQEMSAKNNQKIDKQQIQKTEAQINNNNPEQRNLKINRKNQETEPEADEETMISPKDLSEEDFNEIQMLLALRDIVRIEKYLNNIIKQMNESIFGDLENTLLINRFTQSFQIYEVILSVYKKYQIHRQKIGEKTEYLKKVISYGVQYIERSDETTMKFVGNEHGEKIDDANGKVFKQILSNMELNVKEFNENIQLDLPKYFEKIDQTHRNPMIDDVSKVKGLIDACINLIGFKKESLELNVREIMDLRNLILENPKYHKKMTSSKYSNVVFPKTLTRVGFSILLFWIYSIY